MTKTSAALTATQLDELKRRALRSPVTGQIPGQPLRDNQYRDRNGNVRTRAIRHSLSARELTERTA